MLDLILSAVQVCIYINYCSTKKKQVVHELKNYLFKAIMQVMVIVFVGSILYAKGYIDNEKQKVL